LPACLWGAAGIDIQGLPYMINMTLPDVPENYIHRVGRVGRAECLGLAISLVAPAGTQEKVRCLRALFELLKI
jgi:superfamily II DNA/RNA helicase